MMGVPVPSRTQRMLLVEPATPRPLEERGRILYAVDIQEIYGKDPEGRWRRSVPWIHANVAPESRHKDGKTPWWWEVDVLRWLDQQRKVVRG